MDQKRGRIFKLLNNIHFVKWVSSPTEDSTLYWSKWMANHPDRKEDVEVARGIIQSAQLKYDTPIQDEDYDRILENIIHYTLTSKSKKRFSFGRRWVPVGIAATISFLVLFFLYFFQKPGNENIQFSNNPTIEKVANNGTKITTRLPDGTVVILNSGSRISFPEKFANNIREVKLTGEAFFEVKHDTARPFYVRLKKDYVKVLGTSFNIRSYPSDNTVQVAVASGKVAYKVASGEEMILTRDQIATYYQNDGKVELDKFDRLQAFGWKDKILYFKGARFGKIVDELERWYGVEITIKGDFDRRGPYSGTFNNESLEEVLEGLSFIYRFEYQIDGTAVILNNK